MHCEFDALATINIWLNKTTAIIFYQCTLQLIYSIQSIRLTSHLFQDIFLVLILSAQQWWEWNGKREPKFICVYQQCFVDTVLQYFFSSVCDVCNNFASTYIHVCYIYSSQTQKCAHTWNSNIHRIKHRLCRRYTYIIRFNVGIYRHRQPTKYYSLLNGIEKDGFIWISVNNTSNWIRASLLSNKIKSDKK